MKIKYWNFIFIFGFISFGFVVAVNVNAFGLVFGGRVTGPIPPIAPIAGTCTDVINQYYQVIGKKPAVIKHFPANIRYGKPRPGGWTLGTLGIIDPTCPSPLTSFSVRKGGFGK